MNIRAANRNTGPMRPATMALCGALLACGAASGCDGRAAAADVYGSPDLPPPVAAVRHRPDRAWIGLTRDELERRLGPPVGTDGPWVAYAGGVRIEYDLTVAIGFATPVDEGVSCETAAAKLGFASAPAPIADAHGCAWPAGSPHRLGHGHTGRFDRQTRIFEVRLAR